jgi:hypothetical protein
MLFEYRLHQDEELFRLRKIINNHVGVILPSLAWELRLITNAELILG